MLSLPPPQLPSATLPLIRLFLFAALSVLLHGCVVDRTGQSRSLSLQRDLATTHSQVQSLQRQMDEQLDRTSERLGEMEASAALNRRNLADSGALLDTILSELQILRGTFEAASFRLTQAEERSDKVQEDIDFRLEDIERRLAAIEKAQASLALAVPGGDAAAAAAQVAAEGEQLSAEETLARARGYFDAGSYPIALAFLKGFQKRFPHGPGQEDAQFLLAETLMKTGATLEAVQEYQKLAELYPRSARMPTIMLRQGEAFTALGELEDAKLFLNALIKAYPRAPEAEAARKLLEAP